MDPDRWPNFHHYSILVRRLKLDYKIGTGDLHPSLLRDVSLLALASDPPYPFPNVHKVAYGVMTRDALNNIGQLLPPNLKELHISTSGTLGEGCIISMIRLIPWRVPTLSFFKLEAIDLDDVPMARITGAVGNAMSSPSYLTHVNLPSNIITSPVVWEALAELPSLGFLCSNRTIHKTSAASNSYLRLYAGRFPSLRTIDISLPSVYAANLLSGTLPRVLEELEFRIPDFLPSNQLFSGFVTEKQVLRVRIVVDCVNVQLPLSGFTYFSLSGLLRFSHLKFLTIHSPFAANLTDDEIIRFTASLPRLVRLVLTPDPFATSSSSSISPFFFFSSSTRTTIMVLQRLALQSPQLEHIGLYVDTNMHALNEDVNTPYPHFHKLQTLDFGLSRVTETFHVALFISALCPRRPVTVHGGLSGWYGGSYILPEAARTWSDTTRKAWGTVNNAILLLRKHSSRLRLADPQTVTNYTET